MIGNFGHDMSRHDVPLHFQAPNRSVGAQHAVPTCTRPKPECIDEMEYLAPAFLSDEFLQDVLNGQNDV